jgi:coenzyme PQQ synthesis protein D (PqqD)
MDSRMPELTLETVVARRGEPLTADVDGDLVMLDRSQGRYFGVDRVGHRIWDLLERPQTVGDICTELQGQFDVAAERCRADTLDFLAQLADAELLEIR